MKTVSVDGWVLAYQRKSSQTVVYVPSGFEINERRTAVLQDKLGVRVLFKNAEPPDLTVRRAVGYYPGGTPTLILFGDDADIKRARAIVNTYLQAAGIVPAYPNTAPITVVHGEHEWLMVGRQQEPPTTPTDRIKVTEGYTTQQSHDVEQTAEIFINGAHHTMYAIVHEIFHSLSSKTLSSIWEGAGPNLEEAMTEYFTCLATGLFLRFDVRGDTIYAKGLKILRAGIDDGAFSDADMQAAYFGGDATALHKISDYFYPLFNT